MATAMVQIDPTLHFPHAVDMIWLFNTNSRSYTMCVHMCWLYPGLVMSVCVECY